MSLTGKPLVSGLRLKSPSTQKCVEWVLLLHVVIWPMLWRMMYEQSLTTDAGFHIQLLKWESYLALRQVPTSMKLEASSAHAVKTDFSSFNQQIKYLKNLIFVLFDDTYSMVTRGNCSAFVGTLRLKPGWQWYEDGPTTLGLSTLARKYHRRVKKAQVSYQ